MKHSNWFFVCRRFVLPNEMCVYTENRAQEETQKITTTIRHVVRILSNFFFLFLQMPYYSTVAFNRIHNNNWLCVITLLLFCTVAVTSDRVVVSHQYPNGATKNSFLYFSLLCFALLPHTLSTHTHTHTHHPAIDYRKFWIFWNFCTRVKTVARAYHTQYMVCIVYCVLCVCVIVLSMSRSSRATDFVCMYSVVILCRVYCYLLCFPFDTQC